MSVAEPYLEPDQSHSFCILIRNRVPINLKASWMDHLKLNIYFLADPIGFNPDPTFQKTRSGSNLPEKQDPDPTLKKNLDLDPDSTLFLLNDIHLVLSSFDIKVDIFYMLIRVCFYINPVLSLWSLNTTRKKSILDPNTSLNPDPDPTSFQNRIRNPAYKPLLSYIIYVCMTISNVIRN